MARFQVARPESRLGVAPAALRVVVLFSSVDTLAELTLVSRELHDAFLMAKDEMVSHIVSAPPHLTTVLRLAPRPPHPPQPPVQLPNLLRLRSPRTAKVLELLSTPAPDMCALYRNTVQAETMEVGPPRRAQADAVDLNNVVISFEITISDPPQPRRGRSKKPEREVLMATFAAKLGPSWENGGCAVTIPEEQVKALGFNLVSEDEDDWPIPTDRVIRAKAYITVQVAQQPVTFKLYDGNPEDVHFHNGL